MKDTTASASDHRKFVTSPLYFSRTVFPSPHRTSPNAPQIDLKLMEQPVVHDDMMYWPALHFASVRVEPVQHEVPEIPQ